MKVYLMLNILLLTIIIACNSNSTERTQELTNTTLQTDNSISYLALGDSYTIGESVDIKGRWPVQLADSLRARDIKVDDPVIIATTGWRTDQLRDAIESHGNQTYDMVSLLIGVNDQYQKKDIAEYPTNFEQLLDMAIDKASGKKNQVFVVSIPDYGYTPFGASEKDRISRELDEYNRINKDIADRKGVKYFYITDISRNESPEFVAEDKLHPSAVQYTNWVELMLESEEFFQGINRDVND